MTKAGFLNAMSIIGYVFVGLFAFVSTYLCIAYAAGYFNSDKEPVVGLKFANQTEVVLSENGQKYKLKILDKNAEIIVDEEGNQTIIDNSLPVELKLTVRNEDGLIDNSIISVPANVMTGQEFEITALINELDGFDCNVGGDCFLTAESVDGVFKSDKLHIFVDVPVQEIVMSAKNPLTNEVIDLDNASFIYQDKIKLEAEVFPSRALNPHTLKQKMPDKVIEFGTEDAGNIKILDKNSGLVEVSYNNPNISSDELITEPILSAVTANSQVVYDENSTQIKPEAKCNIRVFPIQLNKILLQNPEFSDNGKIINTLLFDEENRIKFSIIDTGLPDVINLDVFLEPTIYNPDNNSNPLKVQLNNFQIYFETNVKKSIGNPIEITREVVKVDGKDTPIWTIVPLRTLEPKEEVNIVFGITGHETKDIKRILNISYNLPDSFEFTDENGNTIKNNVVDLSLTKKGNLPSPSIDKEPDKFYFKYKAASASKMTFSKFVFFVDTEKMTNEVGSLKVKVNEKGEIFKEKVQNEYKDVIFAAGAGNIEVTPYVVRTNADGKPIDCNYNVINEGAARGFVFYDSEKDFLSEDSGKYIVYDKVKFSKLKVNVSENLESFTLYEDYENGDFLNPIGNETVMMGLFNKKRIFAEPNSVLSIPEDINDYKKWKDVFGEILFKIQYAPDSVGHNLIVPTSGNYVNFGIETVGKNTESYKRYIWFDVYTNSDEEINGSINLYLKDTDSNKQISLSPSPMLVKVCNVPVDTISIQAGGTNSIINGFSKYSNIKYWELDLHISNTFQIYNNKNFVRAKWTQYVNRENKPIILPDVELLASPEWQSRKCVPSLQSAETKFYAFDKNIKYSLSDSDVFLQDLNILDIINLSTYQDNDYNRAIHDKKWEIINSLLAHTEPNKYAIEESLETQGTQPVRYSTIQFKDELPKDYALFMVYSVKDATSTANPDFVYVDYKYPSVKYLDNFEVDTKKEICELSKEPDALNEFYYYIDVFSKVLMGKKGELFNSENYDFKAGEYTTNDFMAFYTDEVLQIDRPKDLITQSVEKDYFSYDEILDKPEDPGTSYFKVSLNKAYKIVDDTVDNYYTLKVPRSINVVTNVIWTDELWNSDLTSIVDYDKYFNITKEYKKDFEMKFMVASGRIVTKTS